MPLMLSPTPWQTFFDDEGVIVPFGLLFTYAAGTSDKLATYTDVDGQFANENPITLDSAGRVPSGFFLQAAAYKFVLAPPDDTDPPANPIRTQDDIIAPAPFSVAVVTDGTAGENIGPNMPVYLSQGDGSRTAGRWYKMDADFNYASSTAVRIGWATDLITTGEVGPIQQIGQVAAGTLVTPGTVYYASATGGAITSTPPVNQRVVGVANTASTLILGIEQPWTAKALALTTANTPTAANGGAGTLTRRTDGAYRGLFLNDGSKWNQVLGGVANVLEHGATGDGVTDDSAAIQAVLDTGVSWILFPPGDYNIGTTSLTPYVFGGQTLVGVGVGNNATLRSRILYSGNGSAFVDTHAVNGSGYAQIEIQNLYFVGSGGASTGAAIELNAGGYAFYTFDRVRIGGTFKYGIISDSAIDVTIDRCTLENTGPSNSCHIWVVNGDTRRSNQALGFSNIISITNTQMNGATYGVIDDGGDGILIEGCNFNAHSLSLQMAGRTDFIIQQNDMENGGIVTGEANILFHDRSGVGGGSLNVDKGPCSAGVVEANGLFQDMASASNSLVKFTNTTAATYHRGITVIGNKCGNQLGRSAAFDVTRLGRSYIGQNSDEVTAGPAYTGMHNDAEANTLLLPGGTTDSLSGAFATLVPALWNTKTWTPTAALGDGLVSSTTVTVTGAAVGDPAIASHSSIGTNDVLVSANVESSNTVRVMLLNKTGGNITISSGTSVAQVFKRTA